jgi:gliding motility-associated-like protein
MVFVLLCSNAFGQNYLQFIENKGQWDKNIRFKGDMAAGSFALQSTGYRVLLYNKDDLGHLADATHAHGSAAIRNQVNSSGGISKPVPEGNTGDGSIILRSHVYEMRFLNANKDPLIIPDKPLATSNNYFIGNDSTKWVSDCKTFQGITYKNVYPNIDVRYYTSGGVLKYDFIINPGGNVADIAMYFDGAESLKLRDGALHVKTSVDEVIEMPPYTYQLIGNARKEIPTGYDVKGNIVRFTLNGSYSKAATLVIDPSLIFSTFTGSTADNWGYTATYDGKGNFYAGGIVFSSGQFPTDNGAFQKTFQGGSNTGESGPFDIAIMKFDPTGANRIYATYLGGIKGNEQPHSLIVDGAGNLVIAGRTTSDDYPTQGNLKTYGSNGGWDIVITKLNASGSALIGSVRIGGKSDDGVNIRHKYPVQGLESINRNYGDDARSEVILDAAGNICFASCTQSTDFPTTAVSTQTTLGGTNARGRAQDAVVLKLAPDLSSVIFSVIIGGNDDDAAFVLTINPADNHIFVAGGTASNNFPGNKTGVKYPTFQGGACDGFVVEYTANGVFVKDAFFGTAGADIIYGIQFDRAGQLYISGTTTGNWPVVNAAFNQAAGKQFICKLKPDLSDYIYSTVFGSGLANPNISPTAFLVDRCENVYVSGWGGKVNSDDGFPNSGTTGLPITSDAYQKKTDNSDFYFFVLAKNAQSQLYGSFFGQEGNFGEHVDGGTSRFDVNGVIYQAICANCSQRDPQHPFPTTPGVWSPNNGSQNGCNLAAVKMAFNLAGVGAGLQASISGVIRDTAGCVPLVADFRDTLALGKTYIWDYNDGTKKDTTTIPSTSHTFNTIGLYRVRLISIDSSTCNIADTAFVTMRVRNDEASLGFTSAKLPPCASLAYQFTNTSSAIRPFTATSFRWDFGDGSSQLGGSGSVTHTYAAGGTYDVKLVLIDTNYCNEPDSIIHQIRISPTVKAQFTTPPVGCVPYNAAFTNTSLGGMQFLWDFGDGSSSTATDPTHLYNNTGTYNVRLIATDTNTCNKTDTSAYFAITVSPNPSSAFTYTPQPTQPNAPVSFLNAAIGATRYKWLFGDGDSLVTVRPDTVVQHLYNASGTYNACLVSYNNSGCSDTSCQPIQITIINGVDVPNAFTPNGDGRNDKVYVRGYGIAKMTWSIYNRWGTLVYIGTDPNEGWDGTYKGRLQPQDVYHYTLLIEFSGKERTTQKGDITLLR